MSSSGPTANELILYQRSVQDIIWSCIATIFICCWISVHPNITAPPPPIPHDLPWYKRLLERLKPVQNRRLLCRLELMIWTIIAPELVIMWALRQWFSARESVKWFKGKDPNISWLRGHHVREDVRDLYSDHDNNPYTWTITHGFFVQMGGFVLYENQEPIRMFTFWYLTDLSYRFQFPQISENEIKRFAKTDTLGTTLALAQCLWFIIQCTARKMEGLAITELEIVTAAFAVMNGAMFYLWLEKPFDVEVCVPVPVLERPILRPWKKKVKNGRHCYRWIKNVLYLPFERMLDMISCRKLDFEDPVKIPTFYATVNGHPMQGLGGNTQIPVITSILAMIFGGLHCAAWRFVFPSATEQLLWRVSSATITGLPFLAALVFGIGGYILRSTCSEKKRGVLSVVYTIFYCTIPFYILARVILLTLAVLELRNLRPSALSVVNWTTFLPHI